MPVKSAPLKCQIGIRHSFDANGPLRWCQSERLRLLPLSNAKGIGALGPPICGSLLHEVDLAHPAMNSEFDCLRCLSVSIVHVRIATVFEPVGADGTDPA